VEVHRDEGVANHIGPEPCVGAREGAGEASAGDCIGQPSSRESALFPGADAVPLTEGNTARRDIASAWPTRRGRRPWHVQTLLVREPGDLVPDRAPRPVRIGKAKGRIR
jgi:hypothetical protein